MSDFEVICGTFKQTEGGQGGSQMRPPVVTRCSIEYAFAAALALPNLPVTISSECGA